MGEYGNGKGSILAVTSDDGWSKVIRIDASRCLLEPGIGAFYNIVKFITFIKHSPAQRGSGDVGQALDRITPSTVVIGIVRQPFQAAVDKSLMIRFRLVLDNTQSINCRSGG